MSEPNVCMMCGGTPTADGVWCSSCGLLIGETEEAIEQRQRLSGIPMPVDFGFVPANTGTSAFAEAEQLLSASLGPNTLEELGYSRKKKKVLENQDAYFFPIGWVGCCGHLVTKNPVRLVSFGSYIGPGAHIWAYYQGISMADLGKDRRNNLRITRIRDLKNTIKVLKSRFDPRWFDREVMPRLASLPLEIEEIDLYFLISDLLKVKHHAWFDFEITKCGA